MNTRLCFSILTIATVASVAPVCLGGIVSSVSTTRLVSVSNRETFPTTNQSFNGPQFGDWQAQAYARNGSDQPNFNPSGSLLAVTSNQQSNVSQASVSFSGFVFIDYSGASVPNAGCALTNRCDYTFHIEGPCDYQFNAILTWYDLSSQQNEASSVVSLRNLGNAQNVFSFTGGGNSAGTLPTGDYTLSILIQGGTSGLQQTADARRQIDATFIVPAPAASVPLALGIFALRRTRR